MLLAGDGRLRRARDYVVKGTWKEHVNEVYVLVNDMKLAGI